MKSHAKTQRREGGAEGERWKTLIAAKRHKRRRRKGDPRGDKSGNLAHGQALLRKFQNGKHLPACYAGKPTEKTVDCSAVSRFSKIAFTGTRVPLNNHAPLTFAGSRSTASHSFQSSIRKGYRL
jgi:hypothetical protein